MDQEQQHLQECTGIIKENIAFYEKQVQNSRRETDELYIAIQQGDTELYDQLIVSQDITTHAVNSLRKNRAALEKPYFGRVDYEEIEFAKPESIYIGKNGISRNKTDIIIVDWRAPISSVYYENTLGRGKYHVPEVGDIEIDLKLKRTFDIVQGKLTGFYDSDVASNDELLVKYLAKNKDVVLGDIISTIQKEQNEIIRDTPFTDIIVQGVAGSGKTTVAMHRISYILYNYAHRFSPEEFCIIGSNDMLLSYITSGLPELDVSGIGQKRMDLFLVYLLDKDWKKKFKYIQMKPQSAFKSKLDFIYQLEDYLKKIEYQSIPCKSIKDPILGVILSAESIRSALSLSHGLSLKQKLAQLNERLKNRIRLLTDGSKKDHRAKKLSQYRNYFKWEAEAKTPLAIYINFLLAYESDLNSQDVDSTLADIQKEAFDIYDLAAMVFIRKRMTESKASDEFGQIIIDEAQDFGPMIYYVLRTALPECYFTIMGDVSQNINYTTGMNSWDDLCNEVFDPEKEHFRILAKSYRNTIEISEYAGKVLDKASSGAYKIQPVIRHGSPVELYQCSPEEMAEQAVSIIKGIQDRGFDTTAVICRTQEEARDVEQLLAEQIAVEDGTEMNFQKGVMVLPIALTKGLEFDTVLLWNPDKESYQENEGDAKLLYVAITRALHELHILCHGDLSDLFS